MQKYAARAFHHWLCPCIPLGAPPPDPIIPVDSVWIRPGKFISLGRKTELLDDIVNF